MMSDASTIVFIDAQADVDQQLLQSVLPGHEVQILSPALDGIVQITTALEKHLSVQSVAIVAHGVPGCLYLGNQQLSLDTLGLYAADLQRWFKGHSAGVLSLYGCQVAAGDAGSAFLAQLHDLTGAAIAASQYPLGHADLGGQWQLETRLGAIAAAPIFAPTVATNYRGILAGSDDFNTATDLGSVASVSDTGSNTTATHQAGEPIHDLAVANNVSLDTAFKEAWNDSVWWQWTAPTSGFVQIDTLGSNFDTVLAVYTLSPGGTISNLTQVTYNDNVDGETLQSKVIFEAEAGVVYYIAVDGATTATGNVQLNIDTPPVIAPAQLFTVQENAIASTPLVDENGSSTVAVTGTTTTWSITKGNLDNDQDGQAAFKIDNTGKLSVNDAGDLDFERFNSFYTLEVTASDGNFSDTESVFVEVQNVDEAPVIQSITPNLTVVNEGGQISLSGKFIDPEDIDGSYTVTIDWGDGQTPTVLPSSLIVFDGNGNGSFSNVTHLYRDDEAAPGDDTYTISVTVSDGTTTSAPATTQIQVNNVAPTITPSSVPSPLQVNEDGTVSFALTATDLGGSLDPLSWSAGSTAPQNGTLKVTTTSGGNGLVTYTPNANYSGADSFTVQVKDDDGGTSSVTVNVNVAPQPDAPSGLTFAAAPGTPSPFKEGDTYTLVGSFTDPDIGDTFTLTLNWGDGSAATVLTSADLTNNGNGTYSFTTSHRYLDDGSFTVNANVVDSTGRSANSSQVLSVLNVAPTVTPGPSAILATKEDTAASIQFTATDPADTTFTWSVIDAPDNGTLSPASGATGTPQTFTYTPTANYNGQDSFIIQVSDGDGGTRNVSVAVGVSAVNDAPEVLPLTQNLATSEGVAFTLSGVQFKDVDLGDVHTATIQWGDNDTTILDATAFTFSGNVFTITDQKHTYADDGTYQVTVTVRDQAGAATSQTTSIAVANTAPIIFDSTGAAVGNQLSLSGTEDTPIDLLGLRAVDPGTLDTLVWTVETPPQFGSVEFLTSGTGGDPQNFRYVPNPNSTNADSFVLKVSDGDGGFDRVTINIAALTDINDAPVVITNDFNLTEGQTMLVTTNMLDASDVESNDDELIFNILNLSPSEGVFKVDGGTDNQFTRRDILDRKVTFVDAVADNNAPTFSITVTDTNIPAAISNEVEAKVTFTAIDDAPVFAVGTPNLTVDEGGTTTVKLSNISATDEETPNAAGLGFSVSNVVGGEFFLYDPTFTTKTLTTQFTQAEIAANQVVFRHNGEEVVPDFTVTVSDGLKTTTSDAVITYNPMNDNDPVLKTNFLAITEGQTVTLSRSVNLDASDIDQNSTLLTFAVTALTNGKFQFKNGTLIADSTNLSAATFTLQDVINGNVQFVHTDASEAAPTYTLKVIDEGGRFAELPATIQYTPVNDPPSFITNTLTIAEGTSVVLNSDPANLNLVVTDPESVANPGALVFTISQVVNGTFERLDATTGAVTQALAQGGTFTLAEVDAGLIRFTHDGSEVAPTYTLKVTDEGGAGLSNELKAAVSFIEVNDAPQLIRNTLTINEGQLLTLTTAANLSFTDVETTDSLLTYTVTNVDGGYFVVNGVAHVDPANPTVSLATVSFTQSDISAGRVQFQHDDTDTVPAYSVQVTDTGDPAGSPALPPDPSAPVTTSPVAVTAVLNRVNDLPQLDQALLYVTEGGTVVFSDALAGDPLPDAPFANLVASDEEDTANGRGLTYTLSNIVGGQVEFTPTAGAAVVAGGTGNAVTSVTFTQTDLSEGRVVFKHGGSNSAPNFTITVTDSEGGSFVGAPDQVKFIPANDVPTFKFNPFTVTEGQTAILTSSVLSATDEESTASDLKYTVASVTEGEFQIKDPISGVLSPITSFTQTQINQGLIRFAHTSTSEVAPTFTLELTDVAIANDPTLKVNTVLVKGSVADGTINFVPVNDALTVTVNTLSIAEGGTVILNTDPANPNLVASDIESGPDALVYKLTSFGSGFFERRSLAGDVLGKLNLGDTFTQTDVNTGLIQYTHDGGEGLPSYTFTVTDQGGTGLSVDTSLTVGTFTEVNDAPKLLLNALSIQEGQLLTLSTTANLNASDDETAAADLTYTVTNIQGGYFVVNGVAQVDGANPTVSLPTVTFKQGDISGGLVQFQHNGTETAPFYEVKVTDTGDPTGTVADPANPTQSDPLSTGVVAVNPVSFTRQNDLPQLVQAALVMSEGDTVTFSSTTDPLTGSYINLIATDEEDTAANRPLTFTLSNIVAGQVEFTDANGVKQVAGGAGNPTSISFTQQDVVAGRVVFVHDGTPTAPNFSLVITDSEGAATPPLGLSSISFTQVNDLPAVTFNPLTITEGQGTTLSSSLLSATDEESTAANLVYSVALDPITSAPLISEGEFQIKDPISGTYSAVTSFTQTQVNQGLIRFLHSATSEVAPTFTLALTDQGISPDDPTPNTVLITGSVDKGTIQFIGVNDAPVVETNSLSIAEGGTVVLNSDPLNLNLKTTDIESGPEALVYTIKSVTNGNFALRNVAGDVVGPLQVGDTFTQATVDAKLIQFTHNGEETPPAYTLTVTDEAGAGIGLDTTVKIDTFTEVNDAPTLVRNTLSIAEGGIVTLSTTVNLSATDIETADADLTYTITGVAGGYFILNGVPQVDPGNPTVSLPTVSFTQSAISQGRVQFQHDGSETVPAYFIQVTDSGDPAGATSTNDITTDPAAVNGSLVRENDLPVLAQAVLSLTEGDAVTFTSTSDPLTGSYINLIATDEEDGAANRPLTFTLSNIVGGRVEFTTDTEILVAGGPGNPETISFNQQDVREGRVVFFHDGTPTAPSFAIAITDSEGGETQGSLDQLIFNQVNDAPVVEFKTLTVTEGQAVAITTSILSATDEESPAPNLTYAVAKDPVSGANLLSEGNFEVKDPVSGQFSVATSFTQTQVDLGLVRFVHSGNEAAPTFTLTLTDAPIVNGGPTQSKTLVGSVAAGTLQFVSVNDAPTITTNSLAIKEGETVILGGTGAPSPNLVVSDIESPAAALVYTLNTVTNGVFERRDVAGNILGTIKVGDTFTQADVNAGLIQFKHNGGEAPPAYTFTVKDESGAGLGVTLNGTTQGTSPSIVFTNVNDAPSIITNTLTIEEGQAKVLTTKDLNAADPDSLLSDLVFIIRSVENGTFFAAGQALAQGDTFTRDQLTGQLVSFVAADDGTTPSYTLAVTDNAANPQLSNTSADSTVNPLTFRPLNDAPVLLKNTLTVSEGEAVPLSALINLNASDEETNDPAALLFTIGQVKGGEFLDSNGNNVYATVDAAGNPVFQFTLQNVQDGLVVFQHDNSETVPAYTVTVSDPNGGVVSEALKAENLVFKSVNDPPVAANDAGLTDEDTALTLDVIANDVDPDSSLTIIRVNDKSVSVANPTITLNSGATVTLTNNQLVYDPGLVYQKLVNGDVRTETFTYTVNDGVIGSESTATATVTVNGISDNQTNFTILSDKTTLNEGSAITLKGSFTDLDSATHTVTIDWGDGTAPTVLSTGNGISLSGENFFTFQGIAHTYANDGAFKISATSADTTGGAGLATAQITVNEVPPVVGLTFGPAVEAGSRNTLTVGNVTDPGADVITQFLVDWGDGKIESFTTAGMKSHIYIKPGDYAVQVATLDNSGEQYIVGQQTVTSLFARNDFNQDGKADILWREPTSGVNDIWFMDGAAYTGNQAPLPVIQDPNWLVDAISDFNQDGKDDLFWRNKVTGENDIWLMDGVLGPVSVIDFRTVGDPNWEITGTADFNDDGTEDIFWRNRVSGENDIWLLNDTQGLSTVVDFPTIGDPTWVIAGVGDLNGDFEEDLLWRNTVTGQNDVWLMDGTNVASVVSFPLIPDPNWMVMGIADFNGDRNNDLFWRNTATGQNDIWLLNGDPTSQNNVAGVVNVTGVPAGWVPTV